MKHEVKTGSILISEPFMEDKRFEKTIILIVEHNYNGTVGFILNKHTTLKLCDLSPDFSSLRMNVNKGGPVEKNSLFFIHKYPDLIHNSIQIKDGLFWGGDVNDVISGINKQEIKIKNITFFIGCTGWKKNQLIEEIEDGDWIVHNMNLKDLDTTLNWSDLLIKINKEYEIWTKAPINFHLN
mgnify:CR=1 FL=1